MNDRPKPTLARAADGAQPVDSKRWRVTACTDCPLRGTTCGPGLALLRRLVAAVTLADGLTPGVALHGTAEVPCGGATCALHWQAGGGQASTRGTPGGAITMADLSRSLV